MLRIPRFISGLSIILLLSNLFLFFGFWRKPPVLLNDEVYFNATLAKLLKPRWIGSRGHAEVSQFLLEELEALGFVTLRDELFDQMEFTNIVGVMNVDAEDFVLLTCHYDSKELKHGAHYVGATDGAVSCAILLNLIKTLKTFLKGPFAGNEDIGLVLVFFDGHESKDVEDHDKALNGSRRFVEVEFIPLMNIKVIITLNLIGAPSQIYMSHYEQTYVLHRSLAELEAKLEEKGELVKSHKLFHKLKDHNADIEDDHFPFMEHDVPALHIVPHTFPDAWHTNGDNLESLHWPTIRRMNTILPRFIHEYLSNNEKYMDIMDY